MLATAYFCTGFGCGFIQSVQYTILSEYTLSKWRVLTVGFPTILLHTCMLALVSWLIHDWKYLQLFIVFMILPGFLACSASLDIAFHGLAFGLQVLSGNVYLNLFLFSIVGIPLKVAAIWLQNRFGRRATILLGFSIVGSAGLTAGCIQITNIENMDALTNGCAFIASAGITMTWGPLQIMTIKIYPTVIRNIGLGYLNVIAKVSAVIGPQLVYLNKFIPGIIFFVSGGLAVVSFLLTTLLPETMDRKLPEKIEPVSLNELTNRDTEITRF